MLETSRNTPNNSVSFGYCPKKGTSLNGKYLNNLLPKYKIIPEIKEK
jgi:hypothetical protein